MSRKRIVLMMFGVVSLGLGVWLADIPIGYWQFKQRCEADGGLRVLQPLERDKVWFAEDESDSRLPFDFGSVAAVRTRNSTGQLIDVRRTAGNPANQSLYSESVADASIEPAYKIVLLKLRQVEGIRLFAHGYEIRDYRTGKTLVVFITFSFAHTNPDRTFLGGTTRSICPVRSPQTSQQIARQIYGGMK